MSALVLFEARMFRLLAVTVPVMDEDVPVLVPVLVESLPVPVSMIVPPPVLPPVLTEGWVEER